MKHFIHNRFERLSEWISTALGNPYAFLAAAGIVLLWGVSGPVFRFSDTWQLIINTGTTIATFLMVFLLQNTGNRTIAELQDHLRRLEAQNASILRALDRAGQEHGASDRVSDAERLVRAA
jgi:low affinity Fe/Cu permease